MLIADRLTRYLRDPEAAAQEFGTGDWSLLVREAQRNKLLSRLACLLDNDGHLHLLPENMRRKLEGALRTARGGSRSVRWEVSKIQEALGAVHVPFVLLKGAAYDLAELPAALGRLFVDVDIMVPRENLAQAERALADHGWVSSKLDEYDQKYYRTWMHEIPPMHHSKRNTSLDVHHTILPPTATLKPDAKMLWAAARELPDRQGVFVLSPADMVLHSATHLFHDGDLHRGLRDLVDIDSLLRHYMRDEAAWLKLLDRAREMDLIRPFYYALRYSRTMLDTPVPEHVYREAQNLAAPPPPVDRIMDVLVRAAFDPTRESLESLPARFYRWLLYVRSHYLRMPMYLLIPHLVRKAFTPET